MEENLTMDDLKEELEASLSQPAEAAEEEIGYSIIKGVYLKELEPEFEEMSDTLHIVPTDKTSSARFWKQVRKAMPEEQLEIPCDCSF